MTLALSFAVGLAGVLVACAVWIVLAMKHLPPLTRGWLERKIGKPIDVRGNIRGSTWQIRDGTTRDKLLVYGVNLVMTLFIVAVPVVLFFWFVSTLSAP